MTVQIYENPTVPKGYAVLWLGDVCVHRGRLGELPDVEYDAIDLSPEDFEVFSVNAEATLAQGEVMGNA